MVVINDCGDSSYKCHVKSWYIGDVDNDVNDDYDYDGDGDNYCLTLFQSSRECAAIKKSVTGILFSSCCALSITHSDVILIYKSYLLKTRCTSTLL